jgi:hypothetical protein
MTSFQQPAAAGSEPSMKDKATETVDQGRQAAAQVAHTAADQALEVKEQAVRQARDLVGEVRQHLAGQVDSQHQNLVANLRSLSSELSAMVDGSDQAGMATELVTQARTRIDGAANWLDGREPGQLLDEVKSFARRRPGAFLVGALAAGVVAGRLTRGAVAAHTDDSHPQDQTGRHDAVPPMTTYGPGGGYAHTTGQEGPPYGSSDPTFDAAGSEFGTPTYSAPSSYGGGGAPPYPATGYQAGTAR